MKRFQVFLVGTLLATGSMFAQTSDWSASVSQIKQLIKSDPAQASEQAEQLIKGKNKKNVDLLVAIGRAYLEAGKVDEASNYYDKASKANSKSPAVCIFGGDVAIAKKDAGTGCSLYEQAIYFDPKSEDAYFRLADIYRYTNPQAAIEKLVQLKQVMPTLYTVDQKLATIYYSKNQFQDAADAYANFVNTPVATEDDIVKYAFSLFLVHNFEKSLEIANLGLQKNPKNAAFNRLVMYNNTDLKHYDAAAKAADVFFASTQQSDLSYLDYMYAGHLQEQMKEYGKATESYQKALALDKSKTDLWRNVSDCYENLNDYNNAISAYEKYYSSLKEENQTPDLLFQLGKLMYGKGTQTDNKSVSAAEMKASLQSADSVFAIIAQKVPDSYLGNFWRARARFAMDEGVKTGIAVEPYEAAIPMLMAKAQDDPRFNSLLIEAYQYIGLYYLNINKYAESKVYWNKILTLDPNHSTAKQALKSLK